jgi:hypothetical protein
MNFQQLQKIQAPLMHTILPTLGYNRHTPRALVYGPIQYGGLGIHNIATGQGVVHVKYTMSSLRNNNRDYLTILTLLEAYCITAGIIGNPLKNTTTIEYITTPWLDTTREYLQSINATITLPSTHFPNIIGKTTKVSWTWRCNALITYRY